MDADKRRFLRARGTICVNRWLNLFQTLQNLSVTVSANHTDDIQKATKIPEIDHVATDIGTTNLFSKFRPIITKLWMLGQQMALFLEFGYPLSCCNRFVLSDVPCDLFQIVF